MNDFYAGRRVLVTGATGIIGSALVRALLDRRADVVALVQDWNPGSELLRSGDSARIQVVSGELENLRDLRRAIDAGEVETVFHLGAQTLVGVALGDPVGTFEANIRGSWNLLEACRLQPRVRQVIVASSDKAYGSSATLPYGEDHRLDGIHPYDVSKSCTDLLARTYAKTYGLPVTIARCGNVFGPGDLNWSRIVPGTIRSYLRNEAPIIRSNGKLTRDYVYVKDVAAAYLLLGEALGKDAGVSGEGWNFGPGRPLSVLEIVEEVRAAMGISGLAPKVLNEAKHEIPDQYLDSTKARTRLGWAPKWELGPALAETVDWYRKFLGSTQ